MALSKIILVLVLFTGILFGQEYPDKNVHNLLKSGIEYIISQDYNSANSIFTKLKNDYPELPLGKIYLAAVEIAKNYDFGEEYNSVKIEKLLNESESQAEGLVKKDPGNIWNSYFMGLIKGYKSYFEMLNDSWFSALKDGMSSASWLEDCVDKKSDFYEAYSGLGSYKYWKSRKTEFLSWLPFVKDEKREGISLLENAVRYSFYNSYLAINSLIWVYIDAKKYDLAIAVSQKSLKKYPNSRFFKWGLARAYEETDPRLSIKYYYEILNSYTDLSSSNHYNEIILKHLIAQQYYKIGEGGKALNLLDDILQIKKAVPATADRLAQRLKKVEELRGKLMSQENFKKH